jgi:hypothetical protein
VASTLAGIPIDGREAVLAHLEKLSAMNSVERAAFLGG